MGALASFALTGSKENLTDLGPENQNSLPENHEYQTPPRLTPVPTPTVNDNFSDRVSQSCRNIWTFYILGDFAPATETKDARWWTRRND